MLSLVETIIENSKNILFVNIFIDINNAVTEKTFGYYYMIII